MKRNKENLVFYLPLTILMLIVFVFEFVFLIFSTNKDGLSYFLNYGENIFPILINCLLLASCFASVVLSFTCIFVKNEHNSRPLFFLNISLFIIGCILRFVIRSESIFLLNFSRGAFYGPESLLLIFIIFLFVFNLLHYYCDYIHKKSLVLSIVFSAILFICAAIQIMFNKAMLFMLNFHSLWVLIDQLLEITNRPLSASIATILLFVDFGISVIFSLILSEILLCYVPFAFLILFIFEFTQLKKTSKIIIFSIVSFVLIAILVTCLCLELFSKGLPFSIAHKTFGALEISGVILSPTIPLTIIFRRLKHKHA